MTQQRFRIYQGSWVCASCGAEMVEATDSEGGVVVSHADGCAAVAALAGGQQ